MSVSPKTIPSPSISTFALPKTLVRIAQKSGVCPHSLLQRIEHELGCSWHTLTRIERGQIILTLTEGGVSDLAPASVTPSTPKENEKYDLVAERHPDGSGWLVSSYTKREEPTYRTVTPDEWEKVCEELSIDYNQDWGA